MLNAFSVDVEDGISIAMRDRFNKQIPQTRRVLQNTRQILNLLASQDTRATFFILGQVAEVFPELVRDIHSAGHEIGVHGHNHLVFHLMTLSTAREELYRAKSTLEDLIGEGVAGHRAPCFSIDQSTAWVLDVLLDLGFTYDSSIMPCMGIGYGWPRQSVDIAPITTPGGKQIIEVPLSVTKILGRQIPVMGGSYFRLLPYPISRRFFERIQTDRPVIMYLHPYELDSEPYPEFYFDELRKASVVTQIRMRSFWLRRKSLYSRYDRLLREFRFVPIREVIDQRNKKISR